MRVEENNSNVWRKEKESLPASMTVEASYVMAMVLMALSVLIRTAYGEFCWTTEVMNLHGIVQKHRFREEDQESILNHGQVKKDSGEVEGYVGISGREKEIITKIYEPEEVLRMLTIFSGEGGQQE